jgi:cytochrome c peroxidase
MKSKVILFIIFSLLSSLGLIIKNTDYFIIPKGWPKPVYNFPRNKLSEKKIEIGRRLFYDPRLSRDSTISCASCHSPYNAFAHTDHALSHGIHDSIGKRNAPALMNLAWQPSFMWDGAVHQLDAQALAPIHHPGEMDESIAHVTEKIRGSKTYSKLFFEAYGDSAITGERVLKTLSQFMLTLISAESKYDSVMRKEKKFTAQEEKGLLIFKKHCGTCHSPPLFSNYAFENNGILPDTKLKDAGRMNITHNIKDSLSFKVPTLRNIAFTAPYMHDGRFQSLSEVIQHYTSHQKNNLLSKKLSSPIVLSANEKVDLIAFLLTLSDKKFLFNPKHSFPRESLKE